MDISVEEILRRLLLLGLPLVPLACSNGGGCTGPLCFCGSQPPIDFDRTVTVDVSSPFVTQDAWDACSTSGDCRPLCDEETLYLYGSASLELKTCQRVAGDAGVDGGGAGREAG